MEIVMTYKNGKYEIKKRVFKFLSFSAYYVVLTTKSRDEARSLFFNLILVGES